MFTGLVQAMGTIEQLEASEAGCRLVIDASGWDHRPSAGDSVAISGCCLTAVGDATDDGRLTFDAIPETLSKTTLGSWTEGRRVNLEHSVTAMTLMGGHVVQGHVDGVGRVAHVVTEGEWRGRIELPAELMRYATPKGSVCIDGVSLTIAEQDVQERWLEVALIPETLERTTLDRLAAGDTVNLEMDVLSKTVVHHLENYFKNNRFDSRGMFDQA